MDTTSSYIGLSLIGGRRQETLVEWNARYEAMSFEQDWWFKAGAAFVRWATAIIRAMPVPSTSAAVLRAAQA